MKCHKIILIIALLLPMILSAQILNVSGMLADKTGKPYELAEIVLYKNDSVAVAVEFSDANGKFNIKVQEGDYALAIRQFGKIIYSRELVLNKDTDLGVINIESMQQLQEIIVQGKTKLIERKVDRLVFNVENSQSAAGGDAIDVLKVTPNINVQNDQISIIGKSTLAVMINDRIMQLSGDDLINFLKTIPADNIKNIEVITTPPAKYDAEGNSGLINIKLKKTPDNSWNATVFGAYKQAAYGTGSTGGNFNYNKDKMAFVLSTNYTKGSYRGKEESSIYYPAKLWDSKGVAKYESDLWNGRAGVDYQFTKKWNMGVQYIGSFNKPDIEDDNETNIIDANPGIPNGVITTKGKNLRKRNLNTLNWHTNVDLDTLGRKISADFDYLNYIADNDAVFHSDTYNSAQAEVPNGRVAANNLIHQKINNYSGQVNVEHPLQWMNLSYGTKLSFSKTRNDVAYFDITGSIPLFDTSQSDQFEYKENTQALYASGNKKFGNNKWETQLGLRMENTRTEGYSIVLNEKVKKEYTQFFPTAYITYTPNEQHSFSLNYSKRINRPGFNALNPFKWYSSPYAYSEGNPYLQPSFSHNIEANYGYRDLLQTTLFFSRDTDNSGQVVLLNESDYTQRVTRLNYFDSYSFGFQQVYIFKKFHWLESQNMVVGYFQHSDSKIYPVTPRSNEGLGGSIGTSNNFILNKDKTIRAGFDLQYQFPNRSGDLVYNYGITQLNVSARFSFLDKKLQLTIVGNNLLKAYDFNNKSNRNDIEAYYKGYYDTRYCRVSLLYKWGSSKVNVAERQVSNEEEKNRTN